MSDTSSARQAHRARVEKVALDRLAQRLASQFPEISAEELVRTITGQYEDFDDSRIRDFVPVLVERSVRAEIAQTPQHRA